MCEKLPEKFAGFSSVGLFVLAEPKVSLRLGQRMTANHLAECDRPRASRLPIGDRLFVPAPILGADARLLRPEQMESFNGRMSCMWDIACQPSGYILAIVMDAIDAESARQAELELALLLQAFWRDHAAFPANLSELISAESPCLPDDPCARPGTSLNYRREGGRAILWSICPDPLRGGDVITEILAPTSKTSIRPILDP